MTETRNAFQAAKQRPGKVEAILFFDPCVSGLVTLACCYTKRHVIKQSS